MQTLSVQDKVHRCMAPAKQWKRENQVGRWCQRYGRLSIAFRVKLVQDCRWGELDRLINDDTDFGQSMLISNLFNSANGEYSWWTGLLCSERLYNQPNMYNKARPG